MPERRDQVGDRVQVAKDAVEAFICTRAAGLVSPSITIQGPNDGPSDELNVGEPSWWILVDSTGDAEIRRTGFVAAK